MEILHVVRHNDPGDLVMLSVDEKRAAMVTAAEIINSLEVNDYHRSLSWL